MNLFWFVSRLLFSVKLTFHLQLYMQIALNQDDDETFKKTINNPRRELGKAALRYITDTVPPATAKTSLFSKATYARKANFPSLLNTSKLSTKQIKSFKKYLDIVAAVQKMAETNESLVKIIDFIAKSLMIQNSKNNTNNDKDNNKRNKSLEEMKQRATAFMNEHKKKNNNNDSNEEQEKMGVELMQSFLEQQKEDADTHDVVCLTTIHGAKGREWPAGMGSALLYQNSLISFPNSVFVVRFNAGVIPDTRETAASGFSNESHLEEERRLAYGMSFFLCPPFSCFLLVPFNLRFFSHHSLKYQ